MNPISRISPVSDADAARMVSDAALADLAERITSSPVRAAPARPRRWLFGIPLAAGLAAAVLIATSIGHPGAKVGPLGVGPASAQALVFEKHGRYIDVLVRNPVADPRRYRAEFKAHGLDITLSLVPASPSLVGTLVEMSNSGGADGRGLKTITAVGKCWTGGGGSICPVGVRVPVGFRGQADITFGRAARPGERYETTAPADARGEVMYGLHFHHRTVAAVLAVLRKRHVTVPVFHYTTAKGIGELLPPSRVPATWHVYDADPWAPHQVMLWVGPGRVEVMPAASPDSPVPSPSPTSSSPAS